MSTIRHRERRRAGDARHERHVAVLPFSPGEKGRTFREPLGLPGEPTQATDWGLPNDLYVASQREVSELGAEAEGRRYLGLDVLARSQAVTHTEPEVTDQLTLQAIMA